jgi:hypothetical protein
MRMKGVNLTMGRDSGSKFELTIIDFVRSYTYYLKLIGAGNETRTRDPNLGKVVLYQLSYSRSGEQGF